jgi:hypothetical protein
VVAVQRVDAERVATEAVTEPLPVEAAARRVGDRGAIDAVVGAVFIVVQVSALEDVDAAVDRVISGWGRIPHTPVRVHIY